MGAEEMRIGRVGSERIADLEPMWIALQHRHSELAEQFPGLTARSPQESWARRRAAYERWLSEPDAFVLVAELAGRAVGYALVRVVAGFDSFGPAKRVGSLETLSVLPKVRGRGVGTALMDSIECELAKIGVDRLKLTVVDGNEDAMRFYTRRRLAAVSHVLFGHLEVHAPSRSIP